VDPNTTPTVNRLGSRAAVVVIVVFGRESGGQVIAAGIELR
jgi:hypothetical protein